MGGDDKANNFDRSWLQRANQLIENTGRHGGPPKRRETPRDWREGAGATPEPEPEPKPPTDQLRTSTPPPGAPSTTRKSQGLHALLNRCSLVADKTLGGWFETREMSGSAGTEEETPVGRTIEHDGGEFAPISCPESTKRWRAEYRRRIEHAFATSLADATTSEDEEIAIGDGSAEEKSAFLLNLLAISLCEYGFDARTAAVMDGLSTSLGMSREDYARAVEGLLAEQLKKGYLREQQDLNAQSTAAGRLKKKMLVGLGAVSGGVALGLTAGLAAPVVLPALAAVFGAAYLAGATATTLFIAVFGVGGAGLTKYKVERRYLDIKDFEFVPVAVAVRMRVAIGISGWIREEEDVTLPWTNLASLTIDVYAIRCQIEAFQELGSALKTIMTNAAVKYAAVGVIKTTALSAAVAAMMWPAAVLQVAKLIDNPWSVCANIAEREGLILADALKKRVHGRRPVPTSFPRMTHCDLIGDSVWLFPGRIDNLHLPPGVVKGPRREPGNHP